MSVGFVHVKLSWKANVFTAFLVMTLKLMSSDPAIFLALFLINESDKKPTKNAYQPL